jgi:CheY-like chemotaxis protein
MITPLEKRLQQSAQQPSLKIVVADNDPAVLELLQLDLALEGHDVIATADDGESAVQACRDFGPDVLIVDFRLGTGANGLEVARRVRRSGLRVILHTNYVNPALVSAAGEIGATVVEKGSLTALRRAVVG